MKRARKDLYGFVWECTELLEAVPTWLKVEAAAMPEHWNEHCPTCMDSLPAPYCVMGGVWKAIAKLDPWITGQEVRINWDGNPDTLEKCIGYKDQAPEIDGRHP